MGTKERREREKTLTKQAILHAARQIAQEDGWSGVTIRKIGELIEYSPSMVYEYFSSKEAVLIALLHEGFRILVADMRQAFAAEPDPTEKLYRIAEAYWQMAQAHPDLYQVMHGLSGVSIDPQEVTIAVKEACAIPLEALENWARSKNLLVPDAMDKVEITWCLLHGITSLAIISRVPADHAHSLIRPGLEALVLAWGGC